MRVFLMLRGVPGSGKSSFVKANKLERFTVESDAIRVAINGIKHNEDGELTIPQDNMQLVWETIDKALIARMKNGEFVVLDATNIREEAYRKYKKMAKDNNYRFFVVDFTPELSENYTEDMYIEDLKARNLERPVYKRVPEKVIEKHAKLAFNKTYISKSVLISPEEYTEKVLYRKYDLNEYKAINLYSDMHGNYTTFKKAIGEINDDEFYILLGDYVDRGLENKEMIEWLFENADRPNLIYLQGNHERWMKYHANGEIDKIMSKEYLHQTRPDIESLDDWQNKLKYIVKKLQQVYYFEYAGNNYLCTHAGVNYFDERIINYSENELTYARGDQDKAAELFKLDLERQGITNTYNIHGHISFKEEVTVVREASGKYVPEGVTCDKKHATKTPICKNNVYNINSRVEFGGELIALRLIKYGVIVNRYEAEPLEITEERNTLIKIRRLLSEREVEVKGLSGGILSFAFSKEAFFDKIWNENTIQARGLFYEPDKNRVVARGYKKFFNYGELYDHDAPYTDITRDEMLELWKKHWYEKLEFPVQQYRKENGFLGLVTLKDDELYFATKTVAVSETELMLEAIRLWIALQERRAFTLADLRANVEKEANKRLNIVNEETGEYAVVTIKDNELKVESFSASLARYIKIIDDDGKAYIHKNGFAKILLGSVNREMLIYVLKNHAKDRTLLFEVMDIANDRHVIKYNENKVVLLDAIKNSVVEENYLPYEELVEIANVLGVEVKEKYKEIENWEELLEVIEKWKAAEGLEGVVLVDKEHNMFKLKTDYYNKWKRYRRIQEKYAQRTSVPVRTEEDKNFLDYIVKNKLATTPLWELRDMYEKHLKNL